jgi:diguanylate cyclase (GGDEF)-like protein
MSEARAQRDRRLMQRTAALLSEDYPLDQLLERLCDAVRAELDAAIAFVALARTDGTLAVEACASAKPGAEPIITERSSAYSAYHAATPMMDRGREIAVPITHRERTLGVLAVVGDGSTTYDEGDQRMLTAIARYLAIAVRNQRIPAILTKRIAFNRLSTLAIVLCAVILSVVIGGYTALRAQQSEQIARNAVTERLHNMVSRLGDYVLDAQQLSASTAFVIKDSRDERAPLEKTLLAMLRSARTPEIYGVGVWFAPFAFDGRTRLYGPYAHWTPQHAAILTYEWMRPGYNFPSRPWYLAGLHSNGDVTFTNPYFDTDHVYVTAARAFYRSDGRLAGVVTVDSILPTLEGSLRIRAAPGSFASVTTGDGTLLLSSDDAGLLAFARRSGKVSGLIAVPPSTVSAYESYSEQGNPARFSELLAITKWRASLAVDRGSLQTEGWRFFGIALVAVAGIWIVAVIAIVAVSRSRQQVERTRDLEEQRLMLETEIADRIRAEERLREYAYRDELTGLPNRAFVVAQIATQLERLRLGADDNIAVLFIDIDRFNLINDSLGHATGDRLLAEFGARLAKNTRPGDVVGRLGGDEYVMLIRIASDLEARARAAEVLQSLRHPFVISGHEFFVSASIGIANGDPRYESPEELLRDADAAMYGSKRAGRATFRVFDRSMHADALEQLALETDLRRGLERGEIYAEYQPIVTLADGAIAGFEALARWKHPTRGRVMPDVFIKLAEQSGLIVDIDERIVSLACEAVKGWVADFPDIFVAVNASAAHLARVDDLAIVREAIKGSGVPATAIKVEITETAVMENGEKSLAVLTSLRDLGVRVSIDDFGTGYSSLSHLQSLPIEELKIDRSFVSSMLKNEKSGEIVRAILAISKTLHLRVTAEGIETEEQAARLQRFGIEYGQGYYYGMAVEPEMAGRLLRTRLKRSVGV